MDRNPPLQDEFDEELTRLMCQARDGDVQAFSIVYQRCRGRIEVFLFRMLGHRERAEDGTQEVFLKLWLARERYRPTARALSFIFQVARNHALDELRKHRSRPDETGLPEDTDHLPAILFPEGDPQNELLAAYQR